MATTPLYFVLIKYQHKMTEYNTLNVTSSNSQPNKFKSEIENETEVTLNLSSYLIGISNDKINFSPNLLSTNR